MKTTFIYSLNDPLTKEVRYIGKANKPKKRFYQHLQEKSRTHKNNWVKSLSNQNLKPVLEILDEVNELDWKFWEQYYISLYKSWGFNLVNGTEGGEGQRKGFIFSEESIKKIKATKIKNGTWAKTHTIEAKDKMRLSKLGDKNPMKLATVRKKNSESHKGQESGMKDKHHTVQSRMKMSKSKLGNKNRLGRKYLEQQSNMA